ncbi:prepilin peptidase [Collinsella sp. AGMB00827]|uniref:Prepilin peptidase n=1 Tax=Collinsella ureilytica TaxID=2869515 RepID=A0ABS7MHM0_9ACTN|nr:prepilin peptidase [Collinsella urealyticum]MBY4796798.1 prepilin peptidase [Collinsella urealyticum]
MMFINLLLLLHLAGVVLAGCIDAVSRRFPNPLAVALALVSIGVVGTAPYRGWSTLVSHVLLALLACVACFVFELMWRYLRGECGIGMGDVKFLACLMIFSPPHALLAFAGALLLLGVACALSRQKSLPLIPFIAPLWIALVSLCLPDVLAR